MNLILMHILFLDSFALTWCGSVLQLILELTQLSETFSISLHVRRVDMYFKDITKIENLLLHSYTSSSLGSYYSFFLC